MFGYYVLRAHSPFRNEYTLTKLRLQVDIHVYALFNLMFRSRAWLEQTWWIRIRHLLPIIAAVPKVSIPAFPWWCHRGQSDPLAATMSTATSRRWRLPITSRLLCQNHWYVKWSPPLSIKPRFCSHSQWDSSVIKPCPQCPTWRINQFQPVASWAPTVLSARNLLAHMIKSISHPTTLALCRPGHMLHWNQSPIRLMAIKLALEHIVRVTFSTPLHSSQKFLHLYI